ncbi:MAG: GAF domain-containing protein, partial [Eubacteriales bacterium]|nr:GAF domain-containing protein [Eubacteriales bacterium]
NTILREAMAVTNADGGTLYTLDGDRLLFRILKNRSLNTQQGMDGKPVNIPPVPLQNNYVAGYVALHGQLVNIPDVYESDLFDFSGPRNYDKLMGYRTKSMLVVPIREQGGTVMGVLQLINSISKEGEVQPFRAETEQVVSVLASFAAVALSNMLHHLEIKKLMFSFFNVIISAVDERTPYNASHTQRIVEMLLSLLDFIRETPWAAEITGPFDSERTEIIVMCAWLHDIGKLVTPLSIINKATRLGKHKDEVFRRMELISLLCRLDVLEGRCTQRESQRTLEDILEAAELFRRTDLASTVTEQTQRRIRDYASRQYRDQYGDMHTWLTPEETECLCIPRGTLTPSERREMERHAEITAKLLNKMMFSGNYTRVRTWAASHHEKLDGSGYPDGLSGDQLSTEVRLLTILDILEALTTSERPYKDALSPGASIAELYRMVEQGKLDGALVRVVEASRCWVHPGSMEEFMKSQLTML